jgi:hypothetical protein
LRPLPVLAGAAARDAAGLAREYGLANVATIDTGVDLDFYA